MRPVLVTGAAGFAGRHLLRLVQQAGPVVGWYRPGEPPPEADRTLAHVQWVPLDLRDGAALDAAMARTRPAAIYHLAGAANQGDAWAHSDVTFELNARVTHHLLAAVRRHVPDARVLVTTSAAVYAASDEPLREDDRIGPSTPYGVSKLAQEMVARDAHRSDGLDVVIVRPFNHIGPGQAQGFFAPAFARQIARIEAGLDQGPMRVGNLTPRRDLCDVRDTVRAYRLIMTQARAGDTFNVCRGEAPAIGDLLDALRAAASCPIAVEVDASKLRPVDIPIAIGDPTRLTAVTGWQPTIPLAETLREILDEQRALLRSS